MDVTDQFDFVDGGVLAAGGFSAAGVHCGLKRSGRPDLALLVADEPVPASAVFTRNLVAAAPVVLSRRNIASGRARAVVVNAGNANACTGEQGMRDAEATAAAVSARLGCAVDDVIVCSTGVIGVPLPLTAVLEGVEAASSSLIRRSGDGLAEAIMTTDTFAKQAAVTFDLGGRTVTVGGAAKGSGMIRPNMATMLGFITTDAPLDPEACDAALRSATGTTFNRITVDGDTSTNDTLVLMASGAAGGPAVTVGSDEFVRVAEAIRVVSAELARMIARDGEGATKLVTITVTGAVDETDAEKAAFTIAESPLVKTALFGNDANWGRVAAAAGRSGASFSPDDLSVVFAGIVVCRNGGAVPFDEDAAFAALDTDEVVVEVDLGAGSAQATVLTCDLSYEYVRINGEYRS